MQLMKMSDKLRLEWVYWWLQDFHHRLPKNVILRIEELSVRYWIRDRMTSQIINNGLGNNQLKFYNYALYFNFHYATKVKMNLDVKFHHLQIKVVDFCRWPDALYLEIRDLYLAGCIYQIIIAPTVNFRKHTLSDELSIKFMKFLKGESKISYHKGPLEEWLIATLNFGYTITFIIHQVTPSFRLLHANYGIPTLFHVKSTLSIKV